MARLIDRIEALEKRLSDLEAPQPVKVFFSEQVQEIAEHKKMNPGAKIITITTVCARRCDDTCPHPGGPGCRKQMNEPARSWQPREGASCD